VTEALVKERVERSLYERANGHSYDAVKIFMPAGSKQPVVVHYTEHLPPDVGAAFIWLKNRPAMFTAGLAAGLASFYASASSGQSAAVKFEQIDPALSRYGAVDWDARWERPQISVCWLDNPGYTLEREWVRDAVARTWEAASSARFLGWQNCTQAGADVRIAVDESGPRAYVGRHVVGRSPSMWLNFTFRAWGQNCQYKREACIRAIGAHEFGHVAGFEHEQLQADAPQACVDHLKQTGEWENIDRPPTALTSYDKDSIMNYCNAIWNNNGRLSDGDVKAIQILFPK
jgi:hypothetical protein